MTSVEELIEVLLDRAEEEGLTPLDVAARLARRGTSAHIQQAHYERRGRSVGPLRFLPGGTPSLVEQQAEAVANLIVWGAYAEQPDVVAMMRAKLEER